ncbi:hypothetical protein MTO96_031668 [Rhipicephalus appendiculatus]
MIGTLHAKFLVALFVLTTRASCEDADIFGVIGGLPSVTAIYALPTDTSGDELECLHADLTKYNTDTGKAIYHWTWRDGLGNNKTADNYITRGDTPDIVIVETSNDPGHPFYATLPYFMVMPYKVDYDDVRSLAGVDDKFQVSSVKSPAR